MSAGLFEIISIVAFTLAAIFALISIALFFKLNVKAIIDDLSGKKAERQIRAYREQSVVARKKIDIVSEQRNYYDPLPKEKEESTERIPQVNSEEKRDSVDNSESTMLLSEEATMVLEDANNIGNQKYTIIMDELVIHTGEEI